MAEIDYCQTPSADDWQGPAPNDQYCELPQEAIDCWINEAADKWFPQGKNINPTVTPLIPLEQAFLEHARKWESETAFLSATPMRVLHGSYQSIMAMGPDVVPLLLRDLQKTGRHWFWALRHLTSADPVQEQDRGSVDKMISAWTKWGKTKGLI
jgi:hypothetical protein